MEETLAVWPLYIATLLPIAPSPYTNAIVAARKAALIQSGATDEWNTIQSAAERRVPKALRLTAAVLAGASKREVRFRLEHLTIDAGPKQGSAVWSIGF